MFSHIIVNHLCERKVISHMLICFLYNILRYNKPNKSKDHTGNLFLSHFCRKSNRLWDSKIQNSVWITEGLDNGVLDNWNSTVVCLHSSKHKHTLTASIGLTSLAHLSWSVNYELTESYCTCLQSIIKYDNI